MKRIILFLLLMCPAYLIAQYNVWKPDYSGKKGNSYSYPEAGKNWNDHLLAELKKAMNSPAIHINPEQIPSLKMKEFFLNRQAPIDENMPVIEPQGYFFGIVIKPDTTIDYKLIIREPY